MKKKSNISFGPGAASLILIFVVLTLSVLGMLSLMNARNDKALSQRNARVLERVYALNTEAERARGTLDGVLYELKKSGAPDEGTYLGALRLLLEVSATLDGNDDYDYLTGAMAGIADSDAAPEQKDAALRALIALSAERTQLIDSLRLLASTKIEEDVLTWTLTDESDEVTITDEVYGQRTLACELKVMPLNGEARTQWVSYRLTTTLADEGEEAFFGD